MLIQHSDDVKDQEGYDVTNNVSSQCCMTLDGSQGQPCKFGRHHSNASSTMCAKYFLMSQDKFFIDIFILTGNVFNGITKRIALDKHGCIHMVLSNMLNWIHHFLFPVLN